MATQDYQQSIQVRAHSSAAYQALTSHFHEWWTTPDNDLNSIGDRAKFTFPPQESYWVFEAEQLIREKLVVLKCVEAFHLHEEQAINTEQEWLNTRLIWRITKHPQGSIIHFTHDGLLPALSCYKVCEQGWNHFFVNSLQLYLNTGEGTPHKVET